MGPQAFRRPCEPGGVGQAYSCRDLDSERVGLSKGKGHLLVDQYSLRPPHDHGFSYLEGHIIPLADSPNGHPLQRGPFDQPPVAYWQCRATWINGPVSPLFAVCFFRFQLTHCNPHGRIICGGEGLKRRKGLLTPY